MIFLIWWCFDDHLAPALGNAGIGQIPWWVILLLSGALHGSCFAASSGNKSHGTGE